MEDWIVGLSLLAAVAFIGWALDKAMSKQWEPLKNLGTIALAILGGIASLAFAIFVFPYIWLFIEGLLYAGMLAWFVVGVISLPFLVLYVLWVDRKKRRQF